MTSVPPSVLEGFGAPNAPVAPLGAGLINLTWLVRAERPFVLQRVNAIFDSSIVHNIRAVTDRLKRAGLETPELVPTVDGHLFLEQEGGVYRAQTFVDGETYDKVPSRAHAESAGALIGRFHTALADLDHAFVGLRQGVHDTPRHLATLRAALVAKRDHALYEPVAAASEEVLARTEALPALPACELSAGHGDLKFNNLRFRGSDAVCLVDLDTVGPVHAGYELGDMWRSWCNASGEDDAEARFDLEVFRASLRGYMAERGRALSDPLRLSLLHGVEWVSLELAARFLADALLERYFGWDASRFSTRGEHNLVRGRGQLALAKAAIACRDERADVLRALLDG